MQTSIDNLPEHLKKYVVDQNYSKYTSEDQAVWRYILRQLIDFLKTNAHSSYIDGLEKTGITESEIPRIEFMNEKLNQFGWSALPISGFIPPAAFMEFQSLGILPIASDLRTLDHIHYTPAPDIVHESAGHAPILSDPHFSDYLRKYATIASKAIFSKEDLLIYDAIRELSDNKENPNSTAEEIQECEDNLNKMAKSISYTSEASLLSRMNWWTAEYGLIGEISDPKIFGAGLLSSIGEARSCLKNNVKKIPLTVDCIDYTYDITEPQPQLFVTKNFEDLSKVLDDLSNLMAYKKGGLFGLERALESKTVNTIELNSGLQASGVLKNYKTDNEPIYFQLDGPTQLSENGKQLLGHGCETHAHGFGSPVGLINGQCPSTLSDEELRGINPVIFDSGVCVTGDLNSTLRSENGELILASFNNCKVTFKDEVLFDPSWGQYDMAVGSKITTVFGGPADRKEYGDRIDFKVTHVPQRVYSTEELNLHQLYNDIRSLRENQISAEALNTQLETLSADYFEHFLSQWLVGIELYELVVKNKVAALAVDLKSQLLKLGEEEPQIKVLIDDGIKIAEDNAPTH